MVRLVDKLFGFKIIYLQCFNSSVVRLVAAAVINPIIIPMFQFQCGAIGSFKSGLFASELAQFQFQCGAIGSFVKSLGLGGVSCFNSSVVRLVVRFWSEFGRARSVSIPVWCDW